MPIRPPHAPTAPPPRPAPVGVARRLAVGLVAAGLTAGSAHAQEGHATAPVAATGSMAAAHWSDNTALVTNPAAIALSSRYDVSAQFLGTGSGALRWGASAVDGTTNEYITFGFAYEGGRYNPPFLPGELPGFAITGDEPVNLKQEHDLTFGLAAPFLDRKLSVGLNGTVMIFDNAHNGRGTTGNLDVGLAARPIELLALGFAARDVLPIPEQFARPATLAFGVRAGRDELVTGGVEADLRLEEVQELPFTIKAGVDGAIKEIVHLRGGYLFHGDTLEHQVSWGFGLNSPSGSIDYGMRIPVSRDALAFRDVQHIVSLTLNIKGLTGGDEGAEEDLGWRSPSP